MDLTGARLFLDACEESSALREKFVKKLEEAAPDHTSRYNGQPLKTFAVVRILLGALTALHSLWRCKTLLTPPQLAAYKASVDRFRLAWVGLQWKPTVWVHWMCAHSPYFMQTYGDR